MADGQPNPGTTSGVYFGAFCVFNVVSLTCRLALGIQQHETERVQLELASTSLTQKRQLFFWEDLLRMGMAQSQVVFPTIAVPI